MSVDVLVANLLEDALAVDEFGATASPRNDNSFPTVKEVVEAIKSALKRTGSYHPPTKSVDAFMAELSKTASPEPDITPEEWDRLWVEFEQELKRLDRDDDIAEGRG
jgi:hypothetical protein